MIEAYLTIGLLVTGLIFSDLGGESDLLEWILFIIFWPIILIMYFITKIFFLFFK